MGGQLDGIFLAGSLPRELIILIVTLFICLRLINLSLSLCQLYRHISARRYCVAYMYSVTRRLLELGAELRYVDELLPPMMWRFTVVDDPSVDIFIGRSQS